MYSKDAPFPVYCQPCWWSDKWEPPELEYDASRDFFSQFAELRNKTPHESMQAPQSVDSEYATFIFNAKNTYLSSVILESKNIFYSRFLNKCEDCVGCNYVGKSAKCINVFYSADCYMCKESRNIDGCQNVALSAHCTNLSDCYGCINLRHKKYCIFNQQYSKEDYFSKRKELEQLPIDEQRELVKAFWLKNPMRAAMVFWSRNCSGNEIYYSSNCRQSVLVNYVRDGAYLFEVSSASRSTETTHTVLDCSIVTDYRFSYEVIGGSRSSNCAFGFINDDCLNCRYSMFIYGCSDVFGCIGLRNKDHRILNKEYSKEEYDKLVKKIMGSMKGYGEFFPAGISPFAYNETIAQDYMPLSKEAIMKTGLRWTDIARSTYETTLAPEQLPSIAEAQDSISNEVIACAHRGRCPHQCITAFKITPYEFSLYKNLEASLPTTCPNCRRFMPDDLFKLWKRKCTCAGAKSENGVYSNTISHFHGADPCPNEFETSYAPDRKEIVYCEACYNTEVV